MGAVGDSGGGVHKHIHNVTTQHDGGNNGDFYNDKSMWI